VKQNPPWTQKAARTFFRRALGRVEIAQDLPHPKTLTEEPREVIPGRYHAAGKKKPPQFQEFGTGHYGTVMPTEKEGVVMKVTSDDTEANFVKAALAIEKERAGNWPNGMTKYLDIYRLGGTSHRGRGAYVLWRETLTPHAGHNWHRAEHSDYDRRAVAEGLKEMRVYMSLARSFFKLMHAGVKGEAVLRDAQRQDRNLAARVHEKAVELNQSWIKLSQLFSLSELRVLGKFGTAAVILLALEDQFDVMANTYATQLVGDALNFYLRHGIVLCDIHMGNIGHREVDGVPLVPFIIMDPGHSVFLTDAYNGIGVQEL
jgi:hypothetical protein